MTSFDQQGLDGWDPAQVWFTMNTYNLRTPDSLLPSVCHAAGSPAPSTELLPWGEYATGPIPIAYLVGALEAAGLPDVESSLRAIGIDPDLIGTVAITLCFVDGEHAQYLQFDNGPVSSRLATYELIDDRTIELSFAGFPATDGIEFIYEENLLTPVNWTSVDTDPYAMYVRTALSASPYALQP